MIHIGRAGVKLGAFSEDEVRSGLASGRFQLSDLGWKEGMENWTPLSQFEEFTGPPAAMPPLPGGTEPETIEPVAEAGLPWDERKERGLLAAFAQTVRLVLLKPVEAFGRMRTTGPISGPLIYNLIGGWIGLIAAGVYAVLISRAQPAPPADLSKMEALFYLTPDMAKSAFKLYIILGPVIVTAMVLVTSALAHLFLMLAGGANKSYHVTLRVFCFAWGSAQVFQLFPACGGVLALGWMLFGCVVGMAIAHGTTTGRAVAAMVLLAAACGTCCIGSALVVAAAGSGALR
ncbi:MAG: DUF4339 domain-containing protein [Chthoniobacteraceae bacterium]|jgi:hypothetical protein